MHRILLAALILLAGRAAATGEINVLTNLNSPFPAGCVAVSLPQGPAENGELLFDEDDIYVPSVDDGAPAAQLRVRIWRTGCHDEGYSVVMVRLSKLSGGRVLVPRVFAEAGEVSVPDHAAQLIRHPAVDNVGASGNEINEQGVTYMLSIDRFPITPDSESRFTPLDYNDVFTLEMYWGDYAGAAPSDYALFTIPDYVPQLDPPQSDYPPLHGRMSGQWIIDGMPSTGLSLMVGEQEDNTNFVFALFFTYFDGEPFWVTGNTGGQEPGFDYVEFDMVAVSGGEFFSFGPDSFDQDDLSQEKLGIMSIEAIDCNTLLIGYDFAEAGLGSDVIEARRMVDVAGYDCNAWE